MCEKGLEEVKGTARSERYSTCQTFVSVFVLHEFLALGDRPQTKACPDAQDWFRKYSS